MARVEITPERSKLIELRYHTPERREELLNH
jgi:hypothetical protein